MAAWKQLLISNWSRNNLLASFKREPVCLGSCGELGSKLCTGGTLGFPAAHAVQTMTAKADLCCTVGSCTP